MKIQKKEDKKPKGWEERELILILNNFCFKREMIYMLRNKI